MKNYGVSNKARLLNIARQKKGLTYMQVLLRFIHERFLYRLSVSGFRDNFFLKGGALVYAHERFDARPTTDMDFLGDRVSRDKANISRIFQEICRVKCPEDGVTFDSNEYEIWVEDIILGQGYSGVRIHLTAHLDTIVQSVSMDVGFGDVIVPKPVDLDYPLLLDDLPKVNVAAYSLETVVAEKFQTMIDRAENNSRMKDYFDVYKILHDNQLDMTSLEMAVREVFTNRGTLYMDNHPLFEPGFASSEQRQLMFRNFTKKIGYPAALEFDEVMRVITATLRPMWESLKAR